MSHSLSQNIRPAVYEMALLYRKVETEKALAYLHSSSSIPIVQKDIKSANILRDASCSPKLADFRLSRLPIIFHGFHMALWHIFKLVL
ncbi:hypothetical protein SUGI_0901990 [Cryptomeria japonica]|nr:hypothetical protein SUGI_0901990 [Cryptomeria japonica]